MLLLLLLLPSDLYELYLIRGVILSPPQADEEPPAEFRAELLRRGSSSNFVLEEPRCCVCRTRHRRRSFAPAALRMTDQMSPSLPSFVASAPIFRNFNRFHSRFSLPTSPFFRIIALHSKGPSNGS